MLLLHATCISIDGKGVLLTGASGAGKSDLALRLIDGGAKLVADDQVALRAVDDALLAAPPPAIAGMIEIRHIGLFGMEFLADIPVTLAIELSAGDDILDRLPAPDRVFLLDRAVQRLRLPAFAASTPAKIRAALCYRIVS